MIFPPPPNAHALAVLILAVVALILFTREKIPLETSSFLVLISLAVWFEVFPFHKDFLVLDATADLPFARKAPVALLIMLGIVVTAAVGFLPIAISAPLGALLMILTGCLGWRDATSALKAQVILIVAASLAIGVALLKTGGADYLAQLFVALAGDTSPIFVISGLMLVIMWVTLSWLLPNLYGIT